MTGFWQVKNLEPLSHEGRSTGSGRNMKSAKAPDVKEDGPK